MNAILHLFSEALRGAKANLFHTLLSVLGIVIGVGALVSILSLIDGMEAYAHAQISKTTSLQSILISTENYSRKDGIRVRKEEYGYINYAAFRDIQQRFANTKAFIKYQESGILELADSSQHGVLLIGLGNQKQERIEVRAGRYLSDADLEAGLANVLVSEKLANILFPEVEVKNVVGKEFQFKGEGYHIVGVFDAPKSTYEILCPISIITENSLKANPPTLALEAPTVEEVPALEKEVLAFLADRYAEQASDFQVITSQFRVKQANQGFLIFRLVMGFIVGISVVVGGIGVMNVLLISVTERTSEIGVRKAVGAKRKDIVLQFLSESLTISFIGSLMGILLGVVFTLIAVPIVKHLSEVPFQAAFTVDTFGVIMIVSVATGIIFGTYPALKASRLDPVEAIRRE